MQTCKLPLLPYTKELENVKRKLRCSEHPGENTFFWVEVSEKGASHYPLCMQDLQEWATYLVRSYFIACGLLLIHFSMIFEIQTTHVLLCPTSPIFMSFKRRARNELSHHFSVYPPSLLFTIAITTHCHKSLIAWWLHPTRHILNNETEAVCLSLWRGHTPFMMGAVAAVSGMTQPNTVLMKLRTQKARAILTRGPRELNVVRHLECDSKIFWSIWYDVTCHWTVSFSHTCYVCLLRWLPQIVVQHVNE